MKLNVIYPGIRLQRWVTPTSFKKLSEQLNSICSVSFLTGSSVRGEEITKKCQPDNFYEHLEK